MFSLTRTQHDAKREKEEEGGKKKKEERGKIFLYFKILIFL